MAVVENSSMEVRIRNEMLKNLKFDSVLDKHGNAKVGSGYIIKNIDGVIYVALEEVSGMSKELNVGTYDFLIREITKQKIIPLSEKVLVAEFSSLSRDWQTIIKRAISAFPFERKYTPFQSSSQNHPGGTRAGNL